ncbi:ArsR/SmtB family transcription factor [Psychrobacter sp. CAL346-MNA-CIBAN-0220]|uniref:ArsR/SmtB family transcription factor n=1 Tax=Psychrobacter sp. CAL346-MNA-CIBAN-0220 TaxID=3140457 RepID=UPI00387EE5DF
MTVTNHSITSATTVAIPYTVAILYKEPTLTTSTPATTSSVSTPTHDIADHLESSTIDFVPVDLAKQMQQASLQASQLLKSLSHPDRLLLLCQLTQGEYCVGELESLVGVGQPSLSQQLGILRKDQLVNTRREGKQIYYSIASDDALAVLQLLYQRFCAKTD